MKLQEFQVRLFRNVVDSGPVSVDDVTCLVGKNEAGKSALLQALHALNPAKPPQSLTLLDEYPRWLKKEHEIAGTIGDAVPITAQFELTDDEFTGLEDTFGPGVVQSRDVKAWRKYGDDDFSIDAQVDHGKYIATFLAAVPDRLKAAVGTPGNTKELRDALAGVIASRTEEDAASQQLAADGEETLARLNGAVGDGGSIRGAVTSRVRALVPRTFYFSQYSQLRGRYSIEEVFGAVQNGSGEEEVQAAADFLKLARAVPDTIADWDFEASNAELESTSSLLTGRVKEHWKQNEHLRLRVSLEVQPGAVPESPRRFLQFRVEDMRHDFSNALDRRSTGFRWFVSFLASFLEFESDSNLILLLDEPGLSLHARAQMDLLDTIEGKLANKRQVLYTTHSPFMVRTSNLGRVRIAEDQGPALGSTVSNEAGVVSDPDTLFPLQAALGYDVAQSLFIGDRNVLVEGVSDFIYLTAISDYLTTMDKAALPADARLMPAGGATNIPTFIALLGGKLDFVVLLDGSSNSQKIKNAIDAGRIDAGKVLSLSSFSSVAEADVEDLFTPGEYLALYNGAFGASLTLGDLPGKDRIVSRITRKQGDFNHGVVAGHFARNLAKSLKALSTGTLDRFAAVNAAIAAALPPTT